jgi:hypothetical protein
VLQAGLPIASGKTESAHRYIIQQQIEIPGASWKLENADKMLALHVTRANDTWENYRDSRAALKIPSLCVAPCRGGNLTVRR